MATGTYTNFGPKSTYSVRPTIQGKGVNETEKLGVKTSE